MFLYFPYSVVSGFFSYLPDDGNIEIGSEKEAAAGDVDDKKCETKYLP